jgi:hypothetical protein
MARKDKPYLPLYIQDFMTDEKLIECSASATGVFIKIMCVMHKSIPYGTILLKQKDKQIDKQNTKQSEEQTFYFAYKLVKHLPWSLPIVLSSLTELLNEGVLHINGDHLIQKRMYDDGILSEKRSKSGKKGGKSTQKSIHKVASVFAKAKVEANTDIDIDINNTVHNKDSIKNNTGGSKKIIWNTYPTPDLVKDLPEVKIGAVIQFVKISKQTTVSEDDVKSLWEIFKVQNLTGENYYQNENKVHSHFINWSKSQNINNNEKGNSATDKTPGSTSRKRIDALKDY